MSLVVLKRKSNIKNSKISSRNGFFSINNPRRVDSHRNKVQTQTPMKGNAPRGHGSCCGQYPIVIHKSQYKNYDPFERQFVGDKSNTAISVKNNSSSISTRNKWLKRGYPYYIVKETDPLSYDTYYKQVSEQSSGQNYDNVVSDGVTSNNSECCNDNNANIVKNVGTRDYSDYLKTNFLSKNCLPTPNSKAHYPVPMSGQCSSGVEVDQDNTGTERGNCDN